MNLERLKKEQQPKIKEIWNHYTDNGKNDKSQRLLLLEELSELQAKLFKVANGRIELEDQEVLSEFADVLIMLAQFGVDVWNINITERNNIDDFQTFKYCISVATVILEVCTKIQLNMSNNFIFASLIVFFNVFLRDNIRKHLSDCHISQIYELITLKLDRQLERIKNEKSGKYCGNCRFEEDGQCIYDFDNVHQVNKFDYCDKWETKDEE